MGFQTAGVCDHNHTRALDDSRGCTPWRGEHRRAPVASTSSRQDDRRGLAGDLALLVGGGTAALVGLGLGEPWTVFLLAGVVAGGVSHALRSVNGTLPTMAHPRPRLVMAVCSLLVTGPVAYAVALALLPGFSLA